MKPDQKASLMEDNHEQSFQPRGAVAFFVMMICFYLALWGLFFFIMLGHR